jgi:hypothetical protein
MNSGTNSLTPKKLNNGFRKKGSKVDPAMQDRFQERFVKLTLVCAILPSIVELHFVCCLTREAVISASSSVKRRSRIVKIRRETGLTFLDTLLIAPTYNG